LVNDILYHSRYSIYQNPQKAHSFDIASARDNTRHGRPNNTLPSLPSWSRSCSVIATYHLISSLY
jgi:hypothetical protein